MYTSFKLGQNRIEPFRCCVVSEKSPATGSTGGRSNSDSVEVGIGVVVVFRKASGGSIQVRNIGFS